MYILYFRCFIHICFLHVVSEPCLFNICESMHVFFDVIDIWHLGSIFVRITYILELLFTIYVHEWMHNYGLPIIHGRILVVFFF